MIGAGFAVKSSAVALAATTLATAGVKVTLTASGHTPKVNVRWPYSVSATTGGRAASGRLTAQIVDPLGDAHAVEFGAGSKKVVNWPFKGVFRDYLIWPPEARGIPLTFRVTVRVGTVKRVLTYRVTPR
jgi:hypothetical protein